MADFRAALDNAAEVFTPVTRGDVTAALPGAAQTIEADYEVPFLAHACMEPMNCTVRVDGSGANGRAEIWSGTQSPTMAIRGVTDATGFAQANVTCHVTYMGGGFGRRVELDYAKQAGPGGHGRRGPARQTRLVTRTGYGAGHVPARRRRANDRRTRCRRSTTRVAVPGRDAAADRELHRTRDPGPVPADPGTGPDDDRRCRGTAVRESTMSSIEKVAPRLPVDIGNWRSVGHSFNAFFTESFVDELAAAANCDPLDFRRALLNAHPRHQAVLDLVKEKVRLDHSRSVRTAAAVSRCTNRSARSSPRWLM